MGMQAYDGMMFREALKAGWYDLHKARDTYRSFVQEDGMHKDLALRFAEVGGTNVIRPAVNWLDEKMLKKARPLLPTCHCHLRSILIHGQFCLSHLRMSSQWCGPFNEILDGHFCGLMLARHRLSCSARAKQ